MMFWKRKRSISDAAQARGFYDVDAWSKCADPSLSLEDFLGRRCYEGFSRDSRFDLASRVKVFRTDEDGAAHYYVFARHYASETRLETILAEIEAEISKYKFACVALDPWNSLQWERDLAKKLPENTVIGVPNTVRHLSPAMKEVQAAVLAGRLHHDGDPVLTSAISSVIAREDCNGNFYPREDKSDKRKLDPHSALLYGICRAMLPLCEKRTTPDEDAA